MLLCFEVLAAVSFMLLKSCLGAEQQNVQPQNIAMPAAQLMYFTPSWLEIGKNSSIIPTFRIGRKCLRKLVGNGVSVYHVLLLPETRRKLLTAVFCFLLFCLCAVLCKLIDLDSSCSCKT